MGCQNTKGATSGKPENGESDTGDQSNQLNDTAALDDVEVATVTPHQKELILETWKHLVDNISNVGVITFMK